MTNKPETLLNSYFGRFLDCVNDLVVHANGDVWFTTSRKSFPYINSLL